MTPPIYFAGSVVRLWFKMMLPGEPTITTSLIVTPHQMTPRASPWLVPTFVIGCLSVMLQQTGISQSHGSNWLQGTIWEPPTWWISPTITSGYFYFNAVQIISSSLRWHRAQRPFRKTGVGTGGTVVNKLHGWRGIWSQVFPVHYILFHDHCLEVSFFFPAGVMFWWEGNVGGQGLGDLHFGRKACFKAVVELNGYNLG